MYHSTLGLRVIKKKKKDTPGAMFRASFSGFVCRVSGFRFQVSSFEFRVSNFGFRISGFGCTIPRGVRFLRIGVFADECACQYIDIFRYISGFGCTIPRGVRFLRTSVLADEAPGAIGWKGLGIRFRETRNFQN